MPSRIGVNDNLVFSPRDVMGSMHQLCQGSCSKWLASLCFRQSLQQKWQRPSGREPVLQCQSPGARGHRDQWQNPGA